MKLFFNKAINFKNIVLRLGIVLLSTIIALGIAEMTAFYKIQKIKKNYQDSDSDLAKRYLSEEVRIFRLKYENRLDHLRAYHDLKDNAPVTDLLFTVITEYGNSQHNILLQGDSWANKASSSKFIRSQIKDFSQNKKIGFVASGVGSYSPSPMLVQLKILREEFNLHPSIVVAIFDQTDIGDELDRYKDSILDVDKNILRMRAPEFESLNHNGLLRAKNSINLYSDKFSLHKLYEYTRFRKEEDGLPHWGVHVLDPLYYGVDQAQKNRVVDNISAYISEVFSDKAVKKLIIVTHPHKNHLFGKEKYKANISDLVNLSISNASRKIDIQHLNLNNNFFHSYPNMDYKEIFLMDDPSSHLSDEAYACCYYPAILDSIKSSLKELNK